MALNHSRNEIDPRLLKRMNAIPALARYIRNRGVSYAVSWVHRLTGVFMVMFLGFHIFTLSALTTPAAYAEKMKLYQLPVLVFIEWALALPVVFQEFGTKLSFDQIVVDEKAVRDKRHLGALREERAGKMCVKSSAPELVIGAPAVHRSVVEVHGIGIRPVFDAAIVEVCIPGIQHCGIGNTLKVDIDDLEQ